jgi:iron complex outermembrane receptor protein
MVNNGYNAGRFSSFISLNHDRTDGQRANSDFRILNGFANLGYRAGEHFRLKGDVSLAYYENQNPGPVDNPMFDNLMDVLRGTTSVSLTNTYEKSSGAVQVFYNWGRHEINDGYRTGGTPRTFRFNSEDHNTGVLLYQTFRLLEGNTFTAGIDYKNWGGHAWNDTIGGRTGEIVDRSVNEVAGYVIAQQNVYDVLNLNAGLRFEHSEAYGSQWIPQVGFTLHLLEGNTIKALYSKGYRSPNIRELYISYPPYSIANPHLKPESMQSYELSFGQRIGDMFSAEITGFYLDAKNRITGVQGTLTNINTLHNKGVEVEASYYPSKSLSFTANYSYLHTDNPDLEAAPANKFFLEASYTFSRLTLTADVESVSGLIKVGGSKDDKESYTLLNAKASWLFGSKDKGLSLFVKGENLTGTSYEILKGFPMPAATLMGGVNITF